MRKLIYALLLVCGVALSSYLVVLYESHVHEMLLTIKATIVIVITLLVKRALQRPMWNYVTVFFTALFLGYRRRGVIRRWIAKPAAKIYARWIAMPIPLRILTATALFVTCVLLFWATHSTALLIPIIIPIGFMIERIFLYVFETVVYRYLWPMRRFVRRFEHQNAKARNFLRKPRHYGAVFLKWAETTRSGIEQDIKYAAIGAIMYLCIVGLIREKGELTKPQPYIDLFL